MSITYLTLEFWNIWLQNYVQTWKKKDWKFYFWLCLPLLSWSYIWLSWWTPSSLFMILVALPMWWAPRLFITFCSKYLYLLNWWCDMEKRGIYDGNKYDTDVGLCTAQYHIWCLSNHTSSRGWMVEALVSYTRDPGFDSQADTFFHLPLLFTDDEAVKI